jgi:hypothetical protein
VRNSFRLYLQPVKKEITGAKEVSRRIAMVKKEKIKLFSIGVVFLLTKCLLMGDPRVMSLIVPCPTPRQYSVISAILKNLIREGRYDR